VQIRRSAPLLLAVITVVLAPVLAACGSSGSGKAAPGSRTSTTTAAASPSSTVATTAPSSATTTPRSSSSTTGPATPTTSGDLSTVGTGIVSAGDQTLDIGPTTGSARSVGAGTACTNLADQGWKSKCVEVDTGTTAMVGVVEAKAGPDGNNQLWQVSVWVERGPKLVETLHGGSAEDQNYWAWANIVTSDVLANGSRELVFGFENSGTGEILDVAAVSADGTSVLGNEQISIYKGSATVSGNKVVTYHPIYRNGDANCCPSGGDGTDTVVFSQGHWTVTSSRKTPPPAGSQSFPDDFPDPKL